MSWFLGNSQKGIEIQNRLNQLAAERQKVLALGKFEEGENGSVFTFTDEDGKTVVVQADWTSEGVQSSNWWES